MEFDELLKIFICIKLNINRETLQSDPKQRGYGTIPRTDREVSFASIESAYSPACNVRTNGMDMSMMSHPLDFLKRWG